MLVKGTITVKSTGTAAAPNNRNKKAILYFTDAPFIDCISETNNKEIDHAKNVDVVMSVYNLMEYSDNYSKTSASLWKCYGDKTIYKQ